MKSKLPELIEDANIIFTLNKIYYRFDLVNFNMNQGRLEQGTGFAQKYISEIEGNFKSLGKAINDFSKETVLKEKQEIKISKVKIKY
jgi:hypothetical protein